MAFRTNDKEVKLILDTTIDTTQFIRVASRFIDAKLTGKGLSDGQLQDIEMYIAAHFVTARDPSIKSEETDEAQVTYTGKFGMGFNSSPYGQMAMIIDTSGTLKTLNSSKRKAVFTTVEAVDVS